MGEQAWVWRLCFGLLAVAGAAAVASALLASGGDLFGDVTVRGGTVPVVLVVAFGGLVAVGGVAGFLWRRD